MNLAKSPASTIQILGAEKALFRALKTKHDTPKYGLIYHASLVGQATGKNKGKIARMLAAKAAIGLRVDALSDWSAQGEGKGDDIDEEERSALGVTSRSKIERHLRGLEGKPLLPRGVAVGPNGRAVSTPGKWEVKEAKKYNPDADGVAGDELVAVAPVSEKKSKKEKKSKVEEPKKPLIQEVESESEAEDSDEEMEDVSARLGLAAPNLNGTKAKPIENKSNGDQWVSPILGNTREAKKARKKERHERKLAKADEKIKQRRAEKETEVKKPAKVAQDPDEAFAASLDMSLEKYKRKLADGQIKFGADGAPIKISKKELKKQRKAEAAPDAPSKKRKLEDDEDKSEKKKKKKSKS
jgi:nucleolar protein 58